MLCLYFYVLRLGLYIFFNIGYYICLYIDFVYYIFIYFSCRLSVGIRKLVVCDHCSVFLSGTDSAHRGNNKCGRPDLQEQMYSQK